MIALSSGLSFIDLRFRGVPRIIATAVLHGSRGVTLVDPGPSSTLPVLRAALERDGIAFGDLTRVLLTHVHLDHAGACGSLLRENPRLRIYVHEKGATHLVAPEKLLASAARLYGDAMDQLWGEVLPVPASAIERLAGGEQIRTAGRILDVAYTPGHAVHHVSFFDRDAGTAFVGDTAGIRIVQGGYVLPPTPPPDVDLDAWRRSLAVIETWRPDTLFVTHFGPASPVAPHLSMLAGNLDGMSGLVKTSLGHQGGDEAREAWFVDEVRRDLRRRMSEPAVLAYEAAGRFDLCWRGLARYWRKRAG